GGKVIGWAKLGRVSERYVYRGVREVSIYLERSARGLGGGRFLMEALITYADANGIWTLQSHMFPENIASRRLHERLGFELVGRRRAIAQHHGVWRDTLLLERRNDLQ
ncbi:MAG: GNAT family N-acetyltransferase, partial [Exiguobacterium acetylicum]